VALLINNLRAGNRTPRRTTHPHLALVALTLVATLSTCHGQPTKPPNTPPKVSPNDQKSPVAKGEVVKELDKAILYVYQAKDGTYWFGSDERGVYRYGGKTLVNFTTKDGLVGNRIRGIHEDKSGNVYFTTYEGISKFDGQSFMTLAVAEKSSTTDWKNQPDDLWFVGAQDAGVVFRYDGKSLYRLEFPKTKLGDEHLANFPRSRFPNAIYSPYDVYSILRDSEGNLWFGTSCVGVCRYDGKTHSWLTDKDLVEAPVRSILEDRKGNMWFSYSGQEPFEELRAAKDISKLKEKAKGTIVSAMSIVEDNDGKIWTANMGAGVYKHDGKQKAHFPIKDGNTTITIFAISKDNQGTLWLGTHNGGAYKFDGKAFEKFKP